MMPLPYPRHFEEVEPGPAAPLFMQARNAYMWLARHLFGYGNKRSV